MLPLQDRLNRSRQRGSVLAWLAVLLGLAVVTVIAVVLAVLSLFRIDADSAALRQSVMKATDVQWHRQIEVGVGPFILGLARTGLCFVDLEPEIKSALRAARGASVGIYQLNAREGSLDRSAIVREVDTAMTRRGWDRILVVLGHEECVIAYVPSSIPSTRDLRICLMILEGDQLVVTSLRADPEPVMELLLREIKESTQGVISG
jgi:hypothetical protein